MAETEETARKREEERRREGVSRIETSTVQVPEFSNPEVTLSAAEISGRGGRG